VSRSVGQPDGWGEAPIFLTDEEQFANLQVWKYLPPGVPGEAVGWGD
jgi:hypothetical protein